MTPDELANQIQGLHAMLAMMTGMPIWQLSPLEATMLSKSLLNVSAQYNIDLFSGKTAAFVQLIAACGMVYFPRILALQQMKKQAKQQQVHQEQQADPHKDDTQVDGTSAHPSGKFDFSAVMGQAA